MESAADLFRALSANPLARATAILLGSLAIALTVNLALRLIVSRLIRRTSTDLDDKLLQILRPPVFVTIVLLGVKLAILTAGAGPTALGLTYGVVQTLLIVVWLVAGLRIASAVIEGLVSVADRVSWLDQRTMPLFDNLAKILIFGLAVYGLLRAWDLDVTPWLASAGIAGIALGFAAKDTLANLFGGLYILADAPYKIGDWINLGTGERGHVTRIGLRSTRLMTRDDVEITVPNAQIANSTIVNESGGPSEKFRVEVRVGVAYGSDVDRVREVLLQAARGVDVVTEDPAPRIRFLEMGDSALIFRVLCWVDEPVTRGLCIDRVNTAVYKALRSAEIEIPFPQRVVHLRPAPDRDRP
jgi:small-conductance mechanosensitive channel